MKVEFQSKMHVQCIVLVGNFIFELLISKL